MKVNFCKNSPRTPSELLQRTGWVVTAYGVSWYSLWITLKFIMHKEIQIIAFYFKENI